jgi:hypothetical protein
MYRHLGIGSIRLAAVFGAAHSSLVVKLGGRIASMCFFVAVVAQLLLIALVVATTAGVRSYRFLQARQLAVVLRISQRAGQ